MYGALYFCSRWRMFPSIIMVHPYIYFVNEHFKKLQIRKILKIQQIRLAACAAQPERGVSSDCANRFKKPRRGAACPSLPAVLYGGYCHTPEGAPGRACRLRGTARTRRFERLRKQIQKAEARGLPAPSLPAVLYGGYCHTPEGAPGRACRLSGTARTRRFERLRKQIQKAEGADKSLPPRLFGLPARIRTAGLQSRSLTCYPAAPQVDIVFRTI